jgi:hypothetical protein
MFNKSLTALLGLRPIGGSGKVQIFPSMKINDLAEKFIQIAAVKAFDLR